MLYIQGPAGIYRRATRKDAGNQGATSLAEGVPQKRQREISSEVECGNVLVGKQVCFGVT